GCPLPPQFSRDADSTRCLEYPRQLIPLPLAAFRSIGFNEPVREVLVAREVAVSSETKLLRAGNETNDACSHCFNRRPEDPTKRVRVGQRVYSPQSRKSHQRSSRLAPCSFW